MLKVFDNQGRSFDRYTLIIDTDAFGMSENADSPQGFNNYVGGADQLDFDTLGEEPLFTELPEAVQRAIVERLTDYIEA